MEEIEGAIPSALGPGTARGRYNIRQGSSSYYPWHYVISTLAAIGITNSKLADSCWPTVCNAILSIAVMCVRHKPVTTVIGVEFTFAACYLAFSALDCFPATSCSNFSLSALSDTAVPQHLLSRAPRARVHQQSVSANSTAGEVESSLLSTTIFAQCCPLAAEKTSTTRCGFLIIPAIEGASLACAGSIATGSGVSAKIMHQITICILPGRSALSGLELLTSCLQLLQPWQAVRRSCRAVSPARDPWQRYCHGGSQAVRRCPQRATRQPAGGLISWASSRSTRLMHICIQD